MAQSDFTISIRVDNTPEVVFNSINNVRGWWSEEIEGSTDKLNDEFNYHYQDVHRCKMKIVELVPTRKVVWEVLHNYFSFTNDQNEWEGNKIVFEILEKDNATELRFTHAGLVPEYECFDVCTNAWGKYIGESLRNLITIGKGQPNSKYKPQTEHEKRLAGTSFTSTFLVDKTRAEVLNAVNNVRGWWHGEIEGGTDKPGDEFQYRMKDLHFSKQRIVEMIPDTKVVWMVTDSRLDFLQKMDEWTGTKMIFDIEEVNDKTQLRFTHEGLVPAVECYEACSNGWSKLIQESLLSLITTGTGKRVF